MQQTCTQNIDILDIGNRVDRFVGIGMASYAVNMSLGKRIKKFRRELGISQTELGNAVGAAQTTIAGYEADSSEPSMDMICRIARVLDKSPGVIAFGGIDTATANSLNYAKVVGVIEIGAWREVVDVAAEMDRVAFVPHPSFPAGEQLAFKVNGSSCDLVVPDGGYAIAVPFELFPGGMEGLLLRDKPPLVIAERQRGGAYEYTLREMRRDGDELSLKTRTSDAGHKHEIRLPLDGQADDARVAFVVVAVVSKTI
ncbi:MAG: helix-turn-helix transcriptional regulator [Pseudomonadota bacterium]|nr:helix-turn-helix transcriptional regulator [Pseudomonadota bacterium]